MAQAVLEETKAKRPGTKRKAGTQTAPKRVNTHNKELGQRGESAAVAFLERQGCSILERNWKCIAGEADIIALDDDALHFIEVKTRMGTGKGFPEEAVDARKRRRYEQIAELYLSTYDGFETAVTFDVIAINVLPNGRAILRVTRNVLGCDCR